MKNDFNKLITSNVNKLTVTRPSSWVLKDENLREQTRFKENKNKKITNKLFGDNKKKNIIKKNNNDKYDINDLKIIGITGSCGKTSVAVLVHRYLQSIGKKSVLYSSAYADSPASWLDRKVCYDQAIITEEVIINILNECKEYEAEYLILECWSGAIGRGAFDNIKFDLKVLTSFYSGYMDQTFDNREHYFNLKSKFLTTNDCPVLINMRIEENKEDIYKRRAFIDSITTKKLYYNIHPTCTPDFKDIKLDYYFEDSDNLKEGAKNINMYDSFKCSFYNLKAPNRQARIYKTYLDGFNLDNSLCAYAIADFFEELNEDTWAEFIGSPNLYIVGRSQKIKWKDRTIIISPDTLYLCIYFNKQRNQIEKDYEQNISYTVNNEIIEAPKINKIRLVASPLRGTVSTTKYIDAYINNSLLKNMNKPTISLDNAMPEYYAYCYNNYIDSIILNVLDLGNGDYDKIIEAMKAKLNIPCDDAKNRYTAILKALIQSEKNDVIIVAGRGNRNTNVIDYETIEYGTDLDFIKKACDELYWLD